MSMFTLCSVQAQMFLMMAVGLAARKCGVITQEGRRCLSQLVMTILLPCNVAYAYFGKDLSVFSNLVWVLAISVFQQLFTYGLSLLLWRGYPKEKQAVLRYSIQFSNSGFIGLPVTESFYGSQGLVYACVFTLPINLFMWTTGLPAFIGGRCDWRVIAKKVLLHPCMIASYAGFFILLFPVPWPDFLTHSMRYFSNGLTPVSMLLVGSILADADLKSMFQKDVIFLSLIRLLVVPLVVILLCRPLGLPAMAVQVSALLAGMPIGSMAAILALSYRCDDVLASNCIVFSTVLSLVTLPMIYLFMAYLA
ncbi:MAG: AEC family transporter [Lawsonibacter sp.]